MTPPRETPDDIPALVQRLEALAHRYDMTHAERYEADSEAFYAASGFMAPGKDVPMAMGGQNEHERRAAHEAWIAGRNMEQQYAIRDAAAALVQLASLLATETAQREAAERQSREDTARYRDEYAIVDRVWRALGVTEYDNGPAIDGRVSALRTALAEMTDAWKVEAQQKLDLITERDKLAWALTEAQRERDEARDYIKSCEATLRAHSEAAAIFQWKPL